jgi:anti-sigma factor RsiW
MMKCQECENFLEEYLDGELDERTTKIVEAHLAACEVCANAYDALVSEATLYAAYERGIEVSPRLWGGVEARIRSEMTGGEVGLLQRVSAWFAPLFTAPRFSPALTAALVLVAIALTVGVMKLTGSREQASTEIARNSRLNVNPNAQPAPTTTQPAETSTPAPVESPTSAPNEKTEPKPSPENRKNPSSEQKRTIPIPHSGASVQLVASNKQETPEQLVREAEQRYLAAINMLQRDVASKRPKLDPQTTARFDETLAAIDRSIAETRRTVAQHSNDPVAVQYMLSAYAKKVEVLREMAHIEQ